MTVLATVIDPDARHIELRHIIDPDDGHPELAPYQAGVMRAGECPDRQLSGRAPNEEWFIEIRPDALNRVLTPA